MKSGLELGLGLGMGMGTRIREGLGTLYRLPQPVAAAVQYGCSLYYIRLQPLLHTVAGLPHEVLRHVRLR